jgi:hypothetical protein
MLGLALLSNTVFATLVWHATGVLTLRAVLKRRLSRPAYIVSFIANWITNSFWVGQTGYRIGEMPVHQAEIYYVLVPVAVTVLTLGAFYWILPPQGAVAESGAYSPTEAK